MLYLIESRPVCLVFYCTVLSCMAVLVQYWLSFIAFDYNCIKAHYIIIVIIIQLMIIQNCSILLLFFQCFVLLLCLICCTGSLNLVTL